MCVCSCLSVSKYDGLGNLFPRSLLMCSRCEKRTTHWDRNCFCSPIVKNLRHHQQTFEIRIWATTQIKYKWNWGRDDAKPIWWDGVAHYFFFVRKRSIEFKAIIQWEYNCNIHVFKVLRILHFFSIQQNYNQIF